MELTYVKISSQANQFWDPSNKKQKMLVGTDVFEVQRTATIQKGISSGALVLSSKNEFDKQEKLKLKEDVSEQNSSEKAEKEESKSTKTSTKKTTTTKE